MVDIKPAAIPYKNGMVLDESCFTYGLRFISNVIADIKSVRVVSGI